MISTVQVEARTAYMPDSAAADEVLAVVSFTLDLRAAPPRYARVQGSGLRAQGAGFWVLGSGFRVQGPELRVQGSDGVLTVVSFMLDLCAAPPRLSDSGECRLLLGLPVCRFTGFTSPLRGLKPCLIGHLIDQYISDGEKFGIIECIGLIDGLCYLDRRNSSGGQLHARRQCLAPEVACLRICPQICILCGFAHKFAGCAYTFLSIICRTSPRYIPCLLVPPTPPPSSIL